MADDPKKKLEDDKKKLSEERAEWDKQQALHKKIYTGRPTPTQEEANLIKLGNHPELEPDGSTDPNNPEAMKAMVAEGGSSKPYATRAMSAGHHKAE